MCLYYTTVVQSTTASIWKPTSTKFQTLIFLLKTFYTLSFSISHLLSSEIMTQPTKEQFYVICVCGTDIGVIDPSLGSRRYLVAISNRYQENGLHQPPSQLLSHECVCMHANEQVFAVCVYMHSSMCVWELEPQHCGCVAFDSFVCACFFIFQFSIGDEA